MQDRPKIKTAAEYRWKAAEARDAAEATFDGSLKSTYLHLAETYDELAVAAENIGLNILGSDH